MMPVMPKPRTDSGRKPIPLFGLGNQQRSPFLSTSDRVNCVVELTENGRQQAAILGLGGLSRYLSLGEIPPRGGFVRKGTLTFYMAVGNQIVVAAPGQALVTIATLTTDSGPVWMEDNGLQLFINDGVQPLIYTYATGITVPVTASHMPGTRGAVYLQQRFFAFDPATGKVYASAQKDGTSWNALDFITPSAKPTSILTLRRLFNDLCIVGSQTVEWWSGTSSTISGALGFQPSANAATEIGGVAEQGLAIANQRPFMLGQGEGQPGVYEITGYSLQKISPPALDDALAKLPNIASAICTGYIISGHPLFQVTIPGDTADTSLTWVYDGLSNLWSKRTSYNKPYYRGLYAFATNSSVFITDAFTGAVHRMSDTVYQEDGDPLEFEVTGTHLLKEGDQLSIAALQIDMETGLGNPYPPGDDPQAMVSLSYDGGHTWTAEQFVSLGKVGQYKKQAQLWRLGAARDIAVKLRITDPIPRRVAGAYLIPVEGNA